MSVTPFNRREQIVGLARQAGNSMRRGEIALAAGVIGILAVLIVPLPTWLLDIGLALSIAVSILVLMVVLFIERPLDLNSFPTLLLIVTMLRLSLNLATTRLILAHGHEGPAAAGHVIQAFGSLLMQGNFIIGLVVFIILVIVNFVVITKGATRIAEVSARFHLDAMPGKQMAIDADLSSGLLTEDEARAKRKELEQESNFYGSMDGASKFVRGDAIAGLLITAINIIGGMIIGMAQQGLPFGQAADTYTRLSVGDGLVSQIPALVISVAAGMLVTKAGVEGSADKALGKQLAGYPQALGIVAMTAFIAGLLPGMPLIPFWVIAVGSAILAFRLWREQERVLISPKADPVDVAPAAEEPITSALAMDELKIELGFGLLALVNEVQGRKLTDQIKALRRQIAQDLGFVMPAVRILDNMALASESYVIRVKELEAGKGELRLGRLLTMDSRGGAPDLPGEVVREPAFGMPAAWIEDGLREEALFRGCTVVDPATVLTTHLTEVVKENMAELLSIAEVQKLIRELPKEHQKLVEDTIPSSMSWAALQRVLQNLLRERVSIRDLGAIVEAASEVAGQDAVTITEHVRGRLGRQLCAANQAPDGALPILTLSAEWEQAFAESLIGERERQLALPPSQVHDFVAAVRDAFDRAAQIGESPVLLTSPMIRPYVRSLVERFRGHTVVLSQNEVHPRAKLRSVGAV